MAGADEKADIGPGLPEPYGQAELWAGPIPPPAMLEAFERAVPGLAREIVDEFKTEARHRRSLEVRASRLEATSELLGKTLALLFAIGCFLVTFYAIDHDAYWVAGVIGGGTIVSGIAAFLGRGKVD